jgi:hypothetical protein
VVVGGAVVVVVVVVGGAVVVVVGGAVVVGGVVVVVVGGAVVVVVVVVVDGGAVVVAGATCPEDPQDAPTTKSTSTADGRRPRRMALSSTESTVLVALRIFVARTGPLPFPDRPERPGEPHARRDPRKHAL